VFLLLNYLHKIHVADTKRKQFNINNTKKGVDYIGVGCGAMIFNGEGKLFLAKRGNKDKNEFGKWEFPGGGVEFGEKCEDALKREIKEEFGIDIKVLELLEVSDHIIPEENQHWVAPSYVARLSSGEAKIMEPEKCDDLAWFPIDELPDNIIPYVMGANISTWVDTLVAALLLEQPRAFTIVFTEMAVGATVSLVVLLFLYKPYSRVILATARRVTHTQRGFALFLGAILLVPAVLFLV